MTSEGIFDGDISLEFDFRRATETLFIFGLGVKADGTNGDQNSSSFAQNPQFLKFCMKFEVMFEVLSKMQWHLENKAQDCHMNLRD